MITGDFRCEIYDGDRIHVHGVSFGYGDSNPYILHQGKNHLVVKQPGAGDWSSIGQSDYSPARYHLIRIEWLDGDWVGDEWIDNIWFKSMEIIESVVPGRKWHATKKRLIEQLKKIETEDNK